MSKIVVVCTAGSRTGGPEASFQLVDQLNQSNFKACIWLIKNKDVKLIKRKIKKQLTISDYLRANIFLRFFSRKITSDMHIFPEYKDYQAPVFDGDFDDKNIYVFAEKYAWMIDFFPNSKSLIWWLSVDNALNAMSSINLNKLRLPNIFHATQSEYASRFLHSLNIQSVRLSDFTTVPLNLEKKSKGPLICINAGKKVIFDLDVIEGEIRKRIPEVIFIRMQGLSRDDVYKSLASSKIYIDFGNFPGKDRMAREAILLGTSVLVLNVAGASSSEDFDISSEYKINISEVYSDKTFELISNMFANSDNHFLKMASLVKQVEGEKANFQSEVVNFFSKLNIS